MLNMKFISNIQNIMKEFIKNYDEGKGRQFK